MLVTERILWWCENCGKEILFDGPGIIKSCPYCGRKFVLTAENLITETLEGDRFDSEEESQTGGFGLGAFAELTGKPGFQFEKQRPGEKVIGPSENSGTKIQNQR